MKSKIHTKLSIIILNYNGLHYIKRTLPEIIKKADKLHEIIVVDNGSTDKSIRFLEKTRGIKVIKNSKNLGYSKGKNLGVKHAKGEYLLLLDNDILVGRTTSFSKLQEFYQNLPSAAFLNVMLVDKEDISRGITKQYGSYYGFLGIINNRYEKVENILKYPKIIRTAISFGGAMFIKRDIWNQLGGLDESQPFNLDDDDISLRAGILGYKNYLYNKEYYIHLGKVERTKNESFRWKYKYYFSGKLKPIIKNFQWKTILIISPLFLLMTIAKTLKQTVYRNDPLVIYSYISSILQFAIDLPETLRKRIDIQQKRRNSDKVIFQIKKPSY